METLYLTDEFYSYINKNYLDSSLFKPKFNIYNKGSQVVIIVKDDGIGIPKDKQEKILKRFIQVDKSFKRKSEGSGIGLNLVKSFVKMQGEL